MAIDLIQSIAIDYYLKLASKEMCTYSIYLMSNITVKTEIWLLGESKDVDLSRFHSQTTSKTMLISCYVRLFVKAVFYLLGNHKFFQDNNKFQGILTIKLLFWNIACAS